MRPAPSAAHFKLQKTGSSCFKPQQRDGLCGCLALNVDSRKWRERQWGGSCCLSPNLCSGSWGGLHCNSENLHFVWPEGSHDSCRQMLWGAFCFHLTLTGCETVQDHREKIFPLSMTSPSQEWGKWREERGHSWWQPQYHLLLTNSSCCFTYKLALLWTRVASVRPPSEDTSQVNLRSSLVLYYWCTDAFPC